MSPTPSTGRIYKVWGVRVKSGRDDPSMEEVAHDPIRRGPVVAVHAMVMRAERRVSRELEAARCTEAHWALLGNLDCSRSMNVG